MKITDFENNVRGVIVARGYDYYMQGYVDRVTQNGREFTTIAHGTQDYHVFVELDKYSNIIESSCDCPYDKGPICKHQVGAYYSIIEKIKPAKKAVSFETLLTNLPKEQLVNIILDFTEVDALLEGKIRMEYDTEDGINQVAKVINSYGAEDDFLDYRDMMDLGNDLLDILYLARSVSSPIKGVELGLLAFKEALGLIERGDDSSGEIGMVLDEALELVDHFTAETSLTKSQRVRMLEKILETAKSETLDNWDNYKMELLEILPNFNDLTEKREQLIQLIDDTIKQVQNDSYLLDSLLPLKMEFLPQDEVFPFMQKHQKQHAIRIALVEYYMQDGNYLAALKTAEKGQKETSHLGQIEIWKEKRYQAYQALKEPKMQAKLAEELLIGGNFDYYQELKKLPGFDYKTVLTEVKNREQNWRDRVALKIILAEEDLPEILLHIEEYPADIEEYARILVKEYPEEVEELYRLYIYLLAEQAGNRKKYYSVCQVINRSRPYTTMEKVNTLIEDLKKTYKRRPAFIDELSKI